MFGLAPLIAGMLNGLGGSTDDSRIEDSTTAVPLEIYGPKNLRGVLRILLLGSFTHLLGRYVVHELHFPGEVVSEYEVVQLHPNEVAGRNIQQTSPGLWENFIDDEMTISAGEIVHSISSIGFVLQEPPLSGKFTPELLKLYMQQIKTYNLPKDTLSSLQNGLTINLPNGDQLLPPPRRPGRKVVILGDTSDASILIPLSQNADLLIHEATNTYIPSLDVGMSSESVQQRTISRGHSTPQMAGKFAAACSAKVLLLNHFSARYADEGEPISGKNSLLREGHETGVMADIRDAAKSEFKGLVVCARDLWSWEVIDKT
jgi:ribonuclease Z